MVTASSPTRTPGPSPIVMGHRVLQGAGLAAIASGALFALIQVVHPANEVASLHTSSWQVAHLLSFLFPILGIFGITGIQARQLGRAGWPGLVGHVALTAAFVLLTCFGFLEAFVTPLLDTTAPRFVDEVFGILDGEPGPGHLGTLFQINGALYLGGGLLFGVATLRAGVLPRWAAVILMAGTVLSLTAAVSAALAKVSAVVFGAGLAALGYGLLADRTVDQRAGRLADGPPTEG